MGEERILLAHGSGGRMTQRLIKEIFQTAFQNPILDRMLDAAVLPAPGQRIAFTTDSFVIAPLFFPGGDIGKLAVCGTVNDLAVSGAVPAYLSVGMIIEEGFLTDDLRRIAASMAAAAREAGVAVVTGDTKVVEKGGADKLFINTAGIGFVPEHVRLSPFNLCPGDIIIVSGNLGEHGLAILAQREGLAFTTPVQSDCAPLNRLAQAILRCGDGVRCMRDPTRGGLATTLNELAKQGTVGMVVREEALPVTPAVGGACEMLGIDPLYLANEGKLVAIVAPESAGEVLQEMHKLPEGENACIIGEVISDPLCNVALETGLGARRILRMLEGQLLPRIC